MKLMRLWSGFCPMCFLVDSNLAQLSLLRHQVFAECDRINIIVSSNLVIFHKFSFEMTFDQKIIEMRLKQLFRKTCIWDPIEFFIFHVPYRSTER